MRRLQLTASARRDLILLEHYITEQADHKTADRFLDKIHARCERLAALPGTLGTERPDLAPGLRSTPHRGYVIYFRYGDDHLEIVNILDARRDVLVHFDEVSDLN